MRIHAAIAFGFMVSFCASTHAAKPVKITPGSSSTMADGSGMRVYTVQCSDGKKFPIVSIPGIKKWCLKEDQVDCWKKQIKASKMVCK